MNEFEISCIVKTDRFNSHEHITHIWNIKNGWHLTVDDAINCINSKKDIFYILNHSKTKKMYIWVVSEIWKKPYIRAYEDWLWNNSLLSLPVCNNSCKVL